MNLVYIVIYMERGEGVSPPPREVFTIAGKQLDIGDHLDGIQSTPHYLVNEMKPGDDQAIDLIRHLTNLGVSSQEYFTAMPKLLQLSVREDGEWDPELLDVTRFLMKRTMASRGGEYTVKKSEINRVACFADMYGQLQAIKNIVWRDPGMAEKKKQVLELAETYKDRPWSA